MKTITVKIDPLGRPTVEADGFQGASCEVATKPIEDALMGKGGVDRNWKPEYLSADNQQVEEIRQW